MADTLPPMDEAPAEDRAPPAYTRHEASFARPTGLVFACPHAGTYYPPSMNSCAPPRSIRMVEDAAMDRLLANAPAAGAPLLVANFGRAYVDLNRAADDLDPALIQDCPAGPPNGKVLAGYGVLHRLSGDGAPLYDHRLSMEEVRRRLDLAYHPYHAQLADLMQTTRAATGRALLVDWHSMPARATGPNGPDIVLGDRHGSSCDAYWTRTLRQLFEAQGWTVGLNRPFAGGYATQTWGQPAEGFEAIQVEVNRKLYWDEGNQKPDIGWKRCEGTLQRVIARLCQEAARKLSLPS